VLCLKNNDDLLTLKMDDAWKKM